MSSMHNRRQSLAGTERSWVIFLAVIMVHQGFLFSFNVGLGVAGMIFFSDPRDRNIPYPIGNFICAPMILMSFLGAFGMLWRAKVFKSELKRAVLLFLCMLVLPNFIIVIGSILLILFATLGDTFSAPCEGVSQFETDCTLNPDYELYEKLAIAAIWVAGINIVLAVVSTSILCKSSKAFADNTVDFNRPVVQSVNYSRRKPDPELEQKKEQRQQQRQQQLQQQHQTHTMGAQPMYSSTLS